jgi:hypothetical protein
MGDVLVTVLAYRKFSVVCAWKAELDDMRRVTGHPIARATAPPQPLEVAS